MRACVRAAAFRAAATRAGAGRPPGTTGTAHKRREAASVCVVACNGSGPKAFCPCIADSKLVRARNPQPTERHRRRWIKTSTPRCREPPHRQLTRETQRHQCCHPRGGRARSDPPAERTTRSRYAAPHGRDRTLQYLGRYKTPHTHTHDAWVPPCGR